MIEGMRFIGEVSASDEGELEQALSDGETIATVRNDLSDITYTVTGYSATTGKQIWTRTGEGWLDCTPSSPIVCQTTSYEQGVRAIEEASVLSLDKGKMTRLEVGKGGKFEFAGTYDDAAYFLTWQGTDDIHMTSFDASGAPLTDKNLQAPAPEKASDSTVSVDMAGPFASVRTESTSGVYVAGRNGYQEIPVVGPCMALRDGAVCQSKNGLTAVGPDSAERWSIDTDMEVVASTRSMDVRLSDAKELFEGTLADSLRDGSGGADDSGDGEGGSGDGEGDADSASAEGDASSSSAGAGDVNAGSAAEASAADVNGAGTAPAGTGEKVGAGAGNIKAGASVKAAALRAEGARKEEGARPAAGRSSEAVKASKSEPSSSQTASPSDSASTAPSSPAATSESTEPSSPSPKQSEDATGGATGETSQSPSSEPVEAASPRAPRPLDARVLIATEDGPGVATVEGGILTLSDGRVVDLEGGALVGLDLSHEIAVVDVEHRTPKGGENGGVAVVSSILVGGDGTVLASLDSAETERLASDGEGGDLFKPFGFAWQQDFLVFVDAVDRKIGIYELEER
ncbi:MAG: hypothetical protein Q3979_07675 [Actinomycetaceae bacterium]|nr:hypothetical protein [Actinomycetaceae bacterium]